MLEGKNYEEPVIFPIRDVRTLLVPGVNRQSFHVFDSWSPLFLPAFSIAASSNWKSWAIILVLTAQLAACARERPNASIEVSGINFKDVGIAEFSVDGYSGHGVYPNGGGGAFVCCISMPRKWHPGLKVNVRWVEDASVPGPSKQRVVEVPKYTDGDIGIFVVHFYPDDTVKVLVTTKIIGHPDYPYPRPN